MIGPSTSKKTGRQMTSERQDGILFSHQIVPFSTVAKLTQSQYGTINAAAVRET